MRAPGRLPGAPVELVDQAPRQAGLGAQEEAEQKKAGAAAVGTAAIAAQFIPVVGQVVGAVIAALGFIPGVAEGIGKAFGIGKSQHAAAQRLGDSSVLYYSLANRLKGVKTGAQLIEVLKSGTTAAAGPPMTGHRAQGAPHDSIPNHGPGWRPGSVGKELHFAIHYLRLDKDPRVTVLDEWLHAQGIPRVEYIYGRSKTSESIHHLDIDQRAGPGTPWRDLVLAIAKPFADAGQQILEQARREAAARATAAAAAPGVAPAATPAPAAAPTAEVAPFPYAPGGAPAATFAPEVPGAPPTGMTPEGAPAGGVLQAGFLGGLASPAGLLLLAFGGAALWLFYGAGAAGPRDQRRRRR